MTDDTAQAPTAEKRELIREAVTMALYVSLSLLAVLIALPTSTEDSRVIAGLAVLGTAVGLVLAHHVAFRMSTRLVNGGLLTTESVHALKAQAAGGFPVAVLASLPVFLFGQVPGEQIAELLLLVFVALVGYRSARFASSRTRSLIYVAGVVLVVSGVLLVKLVVKVYTPH